MAALARDIVGLRMVFGILLVSAGCHSAPASSDPDPGGHDGGRVGAKFDGGAVGLDGGVLPDGGQPVDGAVSTRDGATCHDECQDAKTQCSGANAVVTCARGSDGCLHFGSPTACQTGQYCALDYCAPHGTWTKLPDMKTARSDFAAVLGPDGRIYAIGGFSGADKVIANVEAYSPSTKTWSNVASLQTARGGLAAAVGGDGRIYAFGGAALDGNGGMDRLDVVEAYSPSTDSWTKIAPLPTARAWLAAVTGRDDHVYVLGGETALTGGLATVEAFSTITDQWATMAGLPTARSSLAAALGADGLVYAIGGLLPELSATDVVEAYTLGSNTWATAGKLPQTAFAVAAATGADGRIYCVGAGQGAVLAYTPSTKAWATAPNMTVARLSPAATAGSHGQVYVLGGVDESGAVLSSGEVYWP